MKMEYPYEHPIQARDYPAYVNETVPGLMPARNNSQSNSDLLEYRHKPYAKGEEPKSQKFPIPSLDKDGSIEPHYIGYAIEKTSPSPTGTKPSWTHQTYRRKHFESSAFRADALKRSRTKLGNGVAQYDKVASKYQKHIDRLLKDLNDAEPDKRLEWVIASVNPIPGPNKKLEFEEVHVIIKRVGRRQGVQSSSDKLSGGKTGNQGGHDGHPKFAVDEEQRRAQDRERAQHVALQELRMRQAVRSAQAQGHQQAPFDPLILNHQRQGEESFGFQRDHGKPQGNDRSGAQFHHQGMHVPPPQNQFGGNQLRSGPRQDHQSQAGQGLFHDQRGMNGHPEQRPPPPPHHPGPKQYHDQTNAHFEQGNAQVPLPHQPRPNMRAQFQGHPVQFVPPPPAHPSQQQQFNVHQSRPAGNPSIAIIQDDPPVKIHQHLPKQHRPTPIQTQSSEAYYDRRPKSKTPPISPRTAIRMQKEQERAKRDANRDFADYSSSDDFSDGNTIFTEAASDNDTIISTPASGRSQYKERSYPHYRTGSSGSKGRKGKLSTRRPPAAHHRASSPPRPTRHHTVRRNSDRRASPSLDHDRRNSERLPPIVENHLRSLEEQLRDMKFQQDRLKEEMIRKDEREKQERLAREREEKADTYGISGGRLDRAYDRQLRGASNTYRRDFYD